MLILLPPSEGKTPPTRGRSLDPESLSFPALTPARHDVLEALTRLCASGPPEAAAPVLGLGPTLHEEVRRNATLASQPTARAERVYSGVLYEALSLRDLEPQARRRAARSVLITSSIFGLVRPGDRIPAYRLSGTTTLPGLGSLAAHWRPVLDPVVRSAAGTRPIVDLRSSPYASWWRPSPDLSAQVVTIAVLRGGPGQRHAVSHANKATKGRVARALLRAESTPRSTAEVADLLAEHGFEVESHPAGRAGSRIDVIVETL